MTHMNGKRSRLSIDIDPDEHQKIRICAALHDESVKAYVLKALRERLKGDLRKEMNRFLTARDDPVLAELWDNEKDSVYDEL